MSWLHPLLSIVDRLIAFRSTERLRLHLITLRSRRRDAHTAYGAAVRKAAELRAENDYKEARRHEVLAIEKSAEIRRLGKRIAYVQTRLDAAMAS